ncbi:MAG: type IV secretion system protein [Patescibacteria group bacterium]|nr:type IV secretion system protein [Patescibacteria group bacterium]
MKKIFENKIALIILLAIFFIFVGNFVFAERTHAQTPAAPTPETGTASGSAGAAGAVLNQPVVNSSIVDQTGQPAPATAAAAVGESLGLGTPGASGTLSGTGSINSSGNLGSSSICQEDDTKSASADIQKATGATQAKPLTEAVRGSGVNNIWKWLLSLIDYLIAAMLIFIAIVNILQIQIDTYAVRKALPNLIMGVILANLSWFFCLALVDLSTAIVNWEQIQGGGNLLAGLYSELFQPMTTSSQYIGVLAAILVGSGSGIVLGFLGFFVGLIVFLIPIALFLVICFLLFIRVYVVEFLVAVSPLAFFAIGFPMTAKFFQQWWDQFWKWVFMAPLVFFLWVFAYKLIGPGGWNGQFVKYVIVCAVLYFSWQLPFKLGGAIMGAWGNLGKALTGTGKGGWFHKKAGEVWDYNKTKAYTNLRQNKILGKIYEPGESWQAKVLLAEQTKEQLKEDAIKRGKWQHGFGDKFKAIQELLESDAVKLASGMISGGVSVEEMQKMISKGGMNTMTDEQLEAKARKSATDAEDVRKHFGSIAAIKMMAQGRSRATREQALKAKIAYYGSDDEAVIDAVNSGSAEAKYKDIYAHNSDIKNRHAPSGGGGGTPGGGPTPMGAKGANSSNIPGYSQAIINQLNKANQSGAGVKLDAASFDLLGKINAGIKNIGAGDKDKGARDSIKTLNSMNVPELQAALKPAMEHINNLENVIPNNMVEKSFPNASPEEKQALRVNLKGEIPAINLGELRNQTPKIRQQVLNNYNSLITNKSQYKQWAIKQEQEIATAEKTGPVSPSGKETVDQMKSNERTYLNRLNNVMNSVDSHKSAQEEILKNIQQTPGKYPGKTF